MSCNCAYSRSINQEYPRKCIRCGEPEQEQKFMHDSENFPILFENHDTVIYKNLSNEIFIKDKKTNTQIRMNFDDGICFTTQDSLVQPYYINGLIGWQIKTK